MLKEIFNQLIDVNGKLNSAKIVKNKELVLLLDNYLVNFPTIQEKFFAFKNNLEFIPKCPCGNNLKWKIAITKYSTYCSRDCKEVKKNKLITLKSNNLKKYGVENVSQLKEVKEKKRLKSLQKYGTECVLQSEQVKEKSRKTSLQRYGVEYHSQSKDIIKKRAISKKINFSKFILPIKLKQLEEQNIFPYEWNLEDYDGVDKLYKFIHLDCNLIFTGNFDNGSLPRCPKCHVLHGTSKIERHLQDTLIQILGNKRVECNNRSLIKPKELDIVIDNKLAIEVNGAYHHSEENEKTTLLEKSNLSPIQVLHFWDFELEEKFDICLSMILNKVSESKNIIYARKCEIKKVDSKEAKEFFNNNHLQGSSNAKYNYGLYYNNELVLCISISKPRFNKNFDMEIHRIATRLFTSVVGGVSKLFKYIIQDLGNISIISYADKRYSNGDIYEKLGFTSLKDSQPNYFWVRHNNILTRYQTQKHKLKNLLGEENFNLQLSESENMKLNNYYKIFDCGNKVYKYVK